MGWIRWTGKTLEFVGKLAQADSFERWAEEQGNKVIADVALKTGGYVFSLGKTQKAKSAVWKDLESIAESRPELASEIQKFVLFYPRVIDSLADHFATLPHTSDELTVIPRYLVNRDALSELRKRLGNSKELADLKGGEAFREYFFGELVEQMDGTFSKVAQEASAEKPLQNGDKWILGFSPHFVWKDKPGHYFVYSSYSETRAEADDKRKEAGRKQAAKLLPKTMSWLATLNRKTVRSGNRIWRNYKPDYHAAAIRLFAKASALGQSGET